MLALRDRFKRLRDALWEVRGAAVAIQHQCDGKAAKAGPKTPASSRKRALPAGGGSRPADGHQVKRWKKR